MVHAEFDIEFNRTLSTEEFDVISPGGYRVQLDDGAYVDFDFASSDRSHNGNRFSGRLSDLEVYDADCAVVPYTIPWDRIARFVDAFVYVGEPGEFENLRPIKFNKFAVDVDGKVYDFSNMATDALSF